MPIIMFYITVTLLSRGVGSQKKCSSQRVQIFVWKGGFFAGKLCGFVWTQNGGKIQDLNKMCGMGIIMGRFTFCYSFVI